MLDHLYRRNHFLCNIIIPETPTYSTSLSVKAGDLHNIIMAYTHRHALDEFGQRLYPTGRSTVWRCGEENFHRGSKFGSEERDQRGRKERKKGFGIGRSNQQPGPTQKENG